MTFHCRNGKVRNVPIRDDSRWFDYFRQYAETGPEDESDVRDPIRSLVERVYRFFNLAPYGRHTASPLSDFPNDLSDERHKSTAHPLCRFHHFFVAQGLV